MRVVVVERSMEIVLAPCSYQSHECHQPTWAHAAKPHFKSLFITVTCQPEKPHSISLGWKNHFSSPQWDKIFISPIIHVWCSPKALRICLCSLDPDWFWSSWWLHRPWQWHLLGFVNLCRQFIWSSLAPLQPCSLRKYHKLLNWNPAAQTQPHP